MKFFRLPKDKILHICQVMIILAIILLIVSISFLYKQGYPKEFVNLEEGTKGFGTIYRDFGLTPPVYYIWGTSIVFF